MSDREEVYLLDAYEYVFANYEVSWSEAYLRCLYNYKAQLADSKTEIESKFLAEAISESSMTLDHLWLGAKKITDVFQWIDGDPITKESKIFQYFIDQNATHPNVSRDCLAISRKYHDVPHFIPLHCSVPRPFICKRGNYLSSVENFKL